MSVDRRRELIEPEHPQLSITRQCELVSISRSSYYGPAKGEPAANLELMRLIDEQFLETPWYGSRQMTRHLRRHGHEINRKRVRRLMARMGLQAVYQRPKTTMSPTLRQVHPAGERLFVDYAGHSIDLLDPQTSWRPATRAGASRTVPERCPGGGPTGPSRGLPGQRVLQP